MRRYLTYFIFSHGAFLAFSLGDNYRADSKPGLIYGGAQPELVNGVSQIPATEEPLVRHAYVVAPNILALTIDAQSVKRSVIRPFILDTNHQVELTGYKIPLKLAESSGVAPWVDDDHREDGFTRLHRQVTSGEKPLGWLVGPEANMLKPFDALQGQPLNEKWLLNAENYIVEIASGQEPSRVLSVNKVYLKSKPNDAGFIENHERIHGQRHQVFLVFEDSLIPGHIYKITFENNGPKGPIILKFNDKKLRTEALHINLAGYDTNQSVKSGFLSTWMGTGGALDYPDSPEFHLLDDITGELAFSGPVKLLSDSNKIEYFENSPRGAVNSNKTSVYALDFSEFSKPGRYKAYIPGIGSSFSFSIKRGIWESAFKLQMKGLLHQRSGIELGSPHTSYKKPIDFHPQHGKRIHLCDYELFFQETSQETYQRNSFKRIQRSILLDTAHEDAWGGWHDATDFDRSILPQRHTRAVHALLDLLQANPAYFEQLSLNLPQGDDSLPDILDEVLWYMNFLLRIQQEDGGMPSALESIEHPRHGETCWLDSLPAALVPSTPQTCYVYAAAAAHLSLALDSYDPILANDFKQSALMAMKWADDNAHIPNIYNRYISEEIDLNRAAYYLYRLNGNRHWADVFERTLQRDSNGRVHLQYPGINYAQQIIAYSLAPGSLPNPKLQQECADTVIALADELLRQASSTAYAALGPVEESMIIHSLQPAWDGGRVTIAAHKLTNDSKYLRALIKSSQHSMGANPMNRGLVSGLGARSHKPYKFGYLYGGLEAPEGIPLYGIRNARSIRDRLDLIEHLNQYLAPKIDEWPDSESYFNAMVPATSEFTITTMTRHIMLWGYLAQYYWKQ